MTKLLVLYSFAKFSQHVLDTGLRRYDDYWIFTKLATLVFFKRKIDDIIKPKEFDFGHD